MANLVCPACDSFSFEELETIDVVGQHRFYAPGDEVVQRRLNEAAADTSLTYQMLRCNKCALEFGSPLKAPTSGWYAVAYRVLNLYPSDRWEFGEVINRLRPHQRLFEIGCGSGMFLDQCRASGIEAQGIDCIEEAVRECAARGLQASLERLGGGSPPPDVGHFDHISAFHLLEHLDNPRSLFERASSLAARDCHLWLSVPSDQRPSRRFGETDILDQPPHHMSRWSPDAFSAIGALTGWKLAEIVYEPMALRAAAWCITTASAPYKREKSFGKFASPWREKAFRLAFLPYALAKRMTTERQLTGFSMLAHFVSIDSAR
jgi:2-polyprenyl-3-methyl-5-hydroxy-6-metoxy-1,4-benzoquinol methylase